MTDSSASTSTEGRSPGGDAPRAGKKAPWIRLDRNEFAGSFGDIGTDLPLILAMIPAAGLDAASVFIMFGLAQVATGLAYGLPMPVQPLKAMAVLVIAQKLSGETLYGAGLAIGIFMFLLTLSGALNWLVRNIPRSVVRGLQLGLGLSLASLALRDYVPSMGWTGYGLAAAAFALTLCLWQNRKFPAALFVIALGALYAVFFTLDPSSLIHGAGFALPQLHLPKLSDVWIGFLVLALPQIPLSLSNSVIATHQTLQDLYPERRVSVRKIGLTYSLANLVLPFFRGIPVCHGCGGLTGHYAFGARTGGSVVIYGALYLLVGLSLSGAAEQLLRAFPQPVLGVVLLFEALVLMRLVRDVADSRRTLTIAFMVAAMAFALPQGFVVGLVAGVAVDVLSRRFNWFRETPPARN